MVSIYILRVVLLLQIYYTQNIVLSTPDDCRFNVSVMHSFIVYELMLIL